MTHFRRVFHSRLRQELSRLFVRKNLVDFSGDLHPCNRHKVPFWPNLSDCPLHLQIHHSQPKNFYLLNKIFGKNLNLTIVKTQRWSLCRWARHKKSKKIFAKKNLLKKVFLEKIFWQNSSQKNYFENSLFNKVFRKKSFECSSSDGVGAAGQYTQTEYIKIWRNEIRNEPENK